MLRDAISCELSCNIKFYDFAFNANLYSTGWSKKKFRRHQLVDITCSKKISSELLF